jgi:DNA-binding XRE family transcriptional regulator
LAKKQQPARGRNKRGLGHIDVEVGINLREHRIRAGLSQTDLGAKIGVTFQQIQKYENGSNDGAITCDLRGTKYIAQRPVWLALQNRQDPRTDTAAKQLCCQDCTRHRAAPEARAVGSGRSSQRMDRKGNLGVESS